ncbi:MAG: ABC transporter ATP-binding protein [Deltaproteobacteria bacterium]|nr:ABC transporter ATP-binding protein [Deltaproteobacteria bacterium]
MSITSHDKPVLEVNNLSIVYSTRHTNVQAVRDVSFDIHRGETLGIVGESGCGKSTIAFALVGYLGANGHVSNGSIRFEGHQMVGRSDADLRDIRGNRVSVVYQDPMQALNPSMRIGDQMTQVMCYHNGHLSQKGARTRIIEMLERVHMPDPHAVIKRYPHQLSGGQTQRVIIALALLNNPSLLIMDEPTTALDVTVEATVLDLVNELKTEFNAGIIFITHNLGVVARVSDKLAVMYAGEIVEQGSARCLFKDPVHPYTRGLMRCVPRLGDRKGGKTLYHIRGYVPQANERSKDVCQFAPRCDYSWEACLEKRPDLNTLETDHSVRCFRANKAPIADEPDQVPEKQVPLGSFPFISEDNSILVQQDLKVTYRHDSGSIAEWLGLQEQQYVKAVDGVDITLKRNRTLGIVGESGCGKSSMAKAIVGLEPVRGGSIEFLGVDINQPAEKRNLETIREMQMVFQNPDSTLNPSYSVGRQIARSVALFKRVPKNQVKEEALRLLHAVRLGEIYYDRLPGQLSGGEKQRVSIARALASRPKLIICDEPVSALDVSVQSAVLKLLLEIQKSSGTSLIFIAHDLSVVRYFSDDVAVMYLGKVVEIGPADSIYQPPYHPYTEALLSAIPALDPDAEPSRYRLGGNLPSPLNPPKGCRFHTRCFRRNLASKKGHLCEQENPPWKDAGHGHRICCHISLDELKTSQLSSKD